MAQSEKVNILVVDDLPNKLLTFQTILEELEENLVLARSGEEALRRLLEQEFAVVLLDVNMPGLDGFETAEMIRRRKKSAHTPIIFITAFGDEVHTSRGYSLGAVDYITAPVVPEILRSKVKVFVDLFRMTDQVKRQAEERVTLAGVQAARAAAEESTRRLAFLAEASRTLAGSLDPEMIVRSLTKLAVPFLADLAGVTLQGEVRPNLWNEFAWESFPERALHTAPSCSPEEPCEELRSAVERVLATGHIEALEKMEVPFPINAQQTTPRPTLRCALVLPLRARGRTLGALTVAQGPSGRSYGIDDIALAEDLAGRAAISLDNARLYQNIQEGDRRKNEFLSMLAHELRNPLAPISNAVAILQLLDIRSPELTQARDIIDRQATHMARLIDDLLDISRLTRGKILLRQELVDLTELVRTTTEDYRSTLDDAGLRFNVILPNRPLWLWGDPTRLAQVVGNVLHNASKFTDLGGQVNVELSEAGSTEAVILIRDTGIGMDHAMLARVFETFAQADRTLDRSKGGLGLGLALVKGLIELHGGKVHVASPGHGRGTEVCIHLPLQETDSARRPSDVPSTPGRPLRVLVVEDNRDTAESMRTLLTLMGHHVQVAHNGEEGFNAARAHRPEIILCDLGMPGKLDGYGVAKMVRMEPQLSNSYLVALTGYGQAEDRRRSREAGFDAHLTKPVDLDHLTEIMNSLPTRNLS